MDAQTPATAAAQALSLVRSLMANWCRDHLRGADQEYAAFLRSAGADRAVPSRAQG